MPLPFPYPLHIGTDLVHIPRILRLITRPGYLSRFTTRILTDPEQSDFRRRFNLPPLSSSSPSSPSPSKTQPPVSREMAGWLAGRFAAKEAARKASPIGAAALGWKDVSVVVGGYGPGGTSAKPEVLFAATKEGNERLARLSLSHDGDYVVATVLAVE